MIQDQINFGKAADIRQRFAKDVTVSEKHFYMSMKFLSLLKTGTALGHRMLMEFEKDQWQNKHCSTFAKILVVAVKEVSIISNASSDSLESMPKMCLCTKFRHQKSSWLVKTSVGKEKEGVKENVIDTPYESNSNTTVEEHFSSENT